MPPNFFVDSVIFALDHHNDVAAVTEPATCLLVMIAAALDEHEIDLLEIICEQEGAVDVLVDVALSPYKDLSGRK